MMRILVDATAVGEGGGGICTFLLGLLEGWNDAGFEDEWRIIGLLDLPEAVDGLVAGTGTVHRRGKSSPERRILTQQLLLPTMTRSRGSWADVLLAITPVIPVAPVGVPVVAVVYDLRYHRFPDEFGRVTRSYRRIAYGYGLRRADGVISISKSTRDDVHRIARRRRTIAEVVYLGADHVDRWDPAPRALGHGIAFAHWSNKRPEVAIAAWAALRTRYGSFSALLHVVGAPQAEIARLTRFSANIGIGDLVRIHPFLAEHEYRQLFASASVVLLPSTLEGFGLPVAEAQRLGIPVVASSVGGMSEVGGDAALYSDDGSATSFASLCAEVLFDADRREDLIRRGRVNSRRFTWRTTAELTRMELERSRVRHRLDR